MSKGRWSLPETWQWAEAGIVAQIVGGGTPPTKDPTNFSEKGVPWLTPADLSGYEDVYIQRGARDLSQHGYSRSGAQLMPAGTVLFTSRAPIGYCVIASNDISTNQGFKNIVLYDGILPEYIRYYLLASKDYTESLARGTTFLELSSARMKTLELPIPPTPEQKRIVDKLNNFFARIGAARNELDRVPLLIARHKQATLDLEFMRFAHHGFRALAEIVDPGRGIPYGIVQTGPPHFGGVPTVRGGDIKQYAVRINDLKEVDPRIEYQYQRTRLRGGEVIISIRGTVGNPAVVGPEMEGFNISREVALIPVGNDADAKFVMYYLGSAAAQGFLLGHVKGVAQRGINLRDLRNLEIPLPDLSSQREAVTYIEDVFSRLDQNFEEYQRAIRLLDRLETTLFEPGKFTGSGGCSSSG